ncbi:unnamed protein product [Sphagnum tenellum]
MRNFYSVGQTTQVVALSTAGLTLVLGKNADIGAADSRNGVGKSTLVQAISFGLYGEPLSNIRRNDMMINNINNKSMLVTIDFTRDGKAYRIERGRKPNLLKFFVADKLVSDVSTDEAQGENKNTQIEIERILGMSHLLFKHLVALNTYTQPFLRLKPAEQREVIEELLGITQLSLRDETLKKKIADTKEIIRDEEAAIKATKEANTRIGEAIHRAKKEQAAWTITQQTKIDRLAVQINEISDIDFAAEIALFDTIDLWIQSDQKLKSDRAMYCAGTEVIAKEGRTLSAEIKRLQTSKDGSSAAFNTRLNRLEVELRRCEDEAKKTPDAQIARLRLDSSRRATEAEAKIKTADAKTNEQQAVIAEIDNADGHTCSTCGQGLEGTDHLDKIIEKLIAKANVLSIEAGQYRTDALVLQKQSADIENEINEVLQTHADKQADWIEKANAVSKEISECKSIHEQEVRDTADKITDLNSELGVISDMINERTSGLADIDAAIKSLGTKPVSVYRDRDEVWKLRETSERLMADLEREVAKDNPHDVNVASLESTLQEIKYEALNDAQSLLKHQDFLHKLLSGKDSFVRKKIIDQNLSYLNTRLNVYLEALGLPHEVRFMPDLSVEISMLGREFDFEQLSRGEMNRVILATSWSFRDIWESMNTNYNFLVIDEVIDNGTDSAGVDAVVTILNGMVRKGKNVFLISHRESLIGRVDRILMVHKEDGFTRFEENAEAI